MIPKGQELVKKRGKRLQITVGAICEGIEAKRFPARQDGSWYSVKRYHLARYALRLVTERLQQGDREQFEM
ncbi:MAG: hypothetical protein M1358_17105, partial [Chloroflexi bacterium]|nr:hypothetical protein [Chloroflexota bacterium]